MPDNSRVKEAIRNLKRELNTAGASPKLTVDGDMGTAFGPKSLAALQKALSTKAVIIPVQGDYFGAPWMGLNNDLLGRDERDVELNARYVPGWKNSGLPGFKTLVGNDHAWCIMRVNYDQIKSGAGKGTGSAGASSLSRYGNKCPYWFGALLDIKHASGGRHACEFLYWIDEENKIAATRDGNRSNMFGIFATDLSGKGDIVVNGPRWPANWPDGQFVSKADVLKAYPFFKVGAKGTGTR